VEKKSLYKIETNSEQLSLPGIELAKRFIRPISWSQSARRRPAESNAPLGRACKVWFSACVMLPEEGRIDVAERSAFSTYGKVLRNLEALRQRMKDLRPMAPRAEVRVSPDILGSVDDTIAEIEREVRSIETSGLDTPFVDLASRTATAFFVERSIHRFSERVLDELIAEVGAGSGALLLFRTQSTEAEVVAARNARKESVEHDPRVSRTIIGKIVEGLDSVLVRDARVDELLADEDSAQTLQLRSVLAIPLRFKDYLAGAIYLENPHEAGAFGEPDRELLLALGRLVAIFLNATLRLDEEIAARKRLYRELKGKTYFDGIVGSSRRMLDVIERVEQVGRTQTTVFIEGESGTGKELIARAVHKASDRSDKPLIVVNCAALPEELLEAELFGTEPGAFTGAVRRTGRCEMADGGTLFLDEIAELSKKLQVKFLRFLQERSFERLGGKQTIEVDVRLVAATNRDLRALVKAGEFREDLYYRIWVYPIELPALRERSEDIPLLIDHFVDVFSIQFGRARPAVEGEVFDCLRSYDWPGNIRQLENVVQRVVVENRGGPITVDDLPSEVHGAHRKVIELVKDPFRRLMSDPPRDYAVLKRRRNELQELAALLAQELEDRFVDFALGKTGGNISRAANEFGMHRTLIHKNLRSRRLKDAPPAGGDES
jgi:Nif-specific regulatory protein